MKEMALIFCFAIYQGLFRRLFGSDCSVPLVGNRFFQHIFNFVVCCTTLYCFGVVWWQSVPAITIYEFIYWARSHGFCYDFGHGQPPDVKRYEQIWWWKFVKKIMPESVWYSFTCDFICMVIRYSLPAILIGVILWNIPAMFMGLILSCGYAFMWLLYDWGFVKNPTEIAELIAGFVSGLLLVL